MADISSLVLFIIFDGNFNLTAQVCEACFYELQKYKGGIRSKDGKMGLKLVLW